MLRYCFALFALVAAAMAEDDKAFSHGGVKPIPSIPVNPDTWLAIIGDVCQRDELARPHSNDTRLFLQCLRHEEMEHTNPNIGVWTIGRCVPGAVFSPIDGYCRPRSIVRRAQATVCQQTPTACQATTTQVQVQAQQVVAQPCPCQAPAPATSSCMCAGPAVYQPQPVAPPPAPVQQQQPCGCQAQPTCPCAPQVTPQPCPLATQSPQNAQENGICSWMIDPLARHPSAANCFLQCQPAPNNLFCGRWRRMPCAPMTIFDVSLQVCTWNPNQTPGNLAPATPAPAPVVATQSCGCTTGTNIGQCGANYNCPGMSQCQVTQTSITASACGACCYFGAIFRR